VCVLVAVVLVAVVLVAVVLVAVVLVAVLLVAGDEGAKGGRPPGFDAGGG
jgi:hypothetical protein